ncbi:hypothetical protein FGKAn22_15930 [Ferrigenium kumadai]|uniref:Uncharacterized protein n=1 Tax=Ferrigenium kumadai TaxID=1682490 RepID=A0AAN1T109_9PROT|nr:ankyrin repeat domain-containing protein [Ferrigenium kumadai]BBI99900.1 hypothetical protein FGKAn22_15930 [Ferrigenium kumadai]
MTRKSKIISVLVGGGIAIFIASYLGAEKFSDGGGSPEVKESRELLDSWGGETSILIQAREKLVHALKVDPQDYLALKELARSQIAEGYINNRNVTYQKNIYVVGNFVPGTLEQAEATVREAIRINPSFAEGYVLLGYIQYQHSKLDEAAKSLAYAEKLGTDDPWLQLNWASINYAKGDYSSGNKRVERVLHSGTTKNNVLNTAYEFLISGYIRTEEHNKAVALYEERIKQNPNDAWLRGNFAGYLTNTLGRNDEAIIQARLALNIMNYGMGEQTLAMALYRKWADMVAQGNAKNGEVYFQEAFKIFPVLSEVMAYGASSPVGENLAKALVSEKGISIDAQAEDGSTALLIATNRNRVNQVRVLLDLHANPNTRDTNGWTPLLSAVDEGNIEIVNMLLAKGADVHMQAPWNGGDAAFFAERNGNTELAAKLKALAEK